MPGECQWLYGATMCDHFDHLVAKGQEGQERHGMAICCEKFR
jgi:hypothetical protein